MCMIENGDGVFTEFENKLLTARKAHQCCECRRTIQAGETYHLFVGVWEREIDRFKTCQHCRVACEWLQAECHGYLFERAEEDIREHCQEGQYAMDLFRVAVGMKKQWTKKNGELMALPTMPKTSFDLRKAFAS